MARKRLAFFLRTKSFLRRWTRRLFLFTLSLILTLANGSMGLTISPSQIQPHANARQLSDTHGLVEKGRKLYKLGRFSEAIEVWQQALQDDRVNGDVLRQAIIYNHLCLAYQKLGLWEKARQAIDESLSRLPYQPDREASTEQLQVLAQALNAKGRLQLTLGQPEDALATWQQAKAFYTSVGDREGKIGSEINQAQALEALGFYRRALKTLLQVEKTLSGTFEFDNLATPDELDDNRPITCLSEGMEVKQKLNSPTLSVQDYAIYVTGFRSLGITYRIIGDLDKSCEALEKSRLLAKKYYPLALTQTQLSLGNTLRSLADRDLESNKNTDAKKNQEKALTLYQQAAQSPSLDARMRAQLNRLKLLIDMQKWQQARSLAPTLLSDINKLPAMQLSVNARINFAESLIQFREATKTDALSSSEIVRLLNTAIQEAQTLNSQRSEAYAWGELGHLYEVRKEWHSAEEYTQKALELARAINAPEVTYRWEWQLGRLREQQQDREGAIAAYEKAIKTLEEIPPNLVALTKNLSTLNSEDDITSDIQFYFRDNIEPVYRELVDLLLREPDPDPAKLDEARTVIQQLQIAELEQLLQCNLQNASSEELDSVVDREGTSAIIYPIILPDRLETIVKLPNRPLLHYNQPLRPDNQKVSQEQKNSEKLCQENNVESILKELYKKVRRPGGETHLKECSTNLYNLLIKPAEKKLTDNGIKTLIFILDSTWQNIPMSILYDGTQYLIEKYAVVIAPPGLELKEPKSLQREQLKAILGGISQKRQGLSELPQVPAQLERIKSTISSTVFLNDDFTRTALQEKINFSTFPVVHLATHGNFSSRGKETFILTWDGKLFINGFNNLLQGRQQTIRQPIELLVLSACETASGDNRASLGLTGIALQSGVRSTLATLWKIIADNSPTELFDSFYKELQENPAISKAEALRRAQVTILKLAREGKVENSSRWAHPYYWASYILIGNWL